MIKLFPCLITKAPRHVDIRASEALRLGRLTLGETALRIHWTRGYVGPKSRFERFGIQKYFLHLYGIKLQPSSP
jgi:hypothetical protein